MNKELSNTINKVVEFTNKHRIDAMFNINTVDDLTGGHECQNGLWSGFEKKAGVYIFMKEAGDSIYYVGMSENDVGTRLYNWLFKKNKVNDEIHKADIVLTITLKDQPYMSPALESYLIANLETKLNIKGVAKYC
jgi:hypothetical protein